MYLRTFVHPLLILYVFGNPDFAPDAPALSLVKQLKPQFPDLVWEIVKPNQDLPFVDKDEVVILDVVQGINQPNIITQNHLDQLCSPHSATAHDFDLGFQLKYLKKLGKLGKVTIIGLPYGEKFDVTQVADLVERTCYNSFMKPETKNWLLLAEEDFDVSIYLFEGAKYPASVYHICQAIEKYLKGVQVELAGTEPKKTHDLYSLGIKSSLHFSEEQLQELENLFKAFNQVRYPDYAQHNYNTRKKVEPLIEKGKELYQWIQTQFKNH